MQRARSAQSRLPQRRGSNSRELRHERRSFVTARLGYLKRRWNPGFATLVGRRVGRGCVLARELLQLYDRHYAHPTSFSRLSPASRLLTLLGSLTQSFPRGYENMWVFVGIGPLWCCRTKHRVVDRHVHGWSDNKRNVPCFSSSKLIFDPFVSKLYP